MSGAVAIRKMQRVARVLAGVRSSYDVSLSEDIVPYAKDTERVFFRRLQYRPQAIALSMQR